ncbi:hypothetical protein ACIOD1_29880 [Streptomyces sp. NPDC088097]
MSGLAIGTRTSVEDVMRIAFEKFCLLLDSETACAALNESGPGIG